MIGFECSQTLINELVQALRGVGTEVILAMSSELKLGYRML